jgi:hypothetical protein
MPFSNYRDNFDAETLARFASRTYAMTKEFGGFAWRTLSRKRTGIFRVHIDICDYKFLTDKAVSVPAIGKSLR